MKKTSIAIMVLGALAIGGCTATTGINTAESGVSANNQAGIATRKLSSGKKQFEQGNYGLAQKDYLAAVEATPKNGVAWLGLAASYDQLGRYDLADDAYETLIKIEGRKPAILNNYGYSHIMRGDMKKARSLMNEARANAPLSPVIESNWNLAYAG